METSSSAPDEHAIRTAAIRARYRQFVIERIGTRRRSPGRVILGIFLCCSGVLIPIGLIQIFRGLRGVLPNKWALRDELAFIDRAEACMAFPMMVNTLLRKPGNQPYPGLFLVSFERGKPEQLDFGIGVMCRFEDPNSANIPEEDIKTFDEMMADEQFQANRRRIIPPSFTDGHVMFACDIPVHPWYLVNQHINDEMPLVPCLAEPGVSGQIRAIPYWCAFDTTPPHWAAQTPVMLL